MAMIGGTRFLRAAWVVALAVAALGLADSALAQARRPLTLEGKQALYQRVIAVPGATLSASPESKSAAGQPITPFTVFYVYDRRSAGNADWLEVGLDSQGNVAGWLPASQAVEWRQTLTVGFKDPAKQPRVLLFTNRDAPKMLAEQNDVAQYEMLRERAIKGDVAGTPVAAIQPDGFIDIRHNFYLVPILSHEDVLVGNNPSRLLQVASVPLHSESAENPYRAAIVFVIDTTLSMQPYIERTREIVRDVYEKIHAAGLDDRVAYGLVAFRGDTSASPDIEYVSKVFSGLTTNGKEFLSKVASVRAATVSTQGFDEDAYSGVSRAIEDIDWNGYFARYMILITDAGPRLADDPLSGTKLGTDDVRQKLVAHGISPWVIHLQTPAGAAKGDHEFAEKEYRELSTVENIGSFYYPVEAGDVGDFGAALSAMMDQLTKQVRAAASGFQPLQASPSLLSETGESSEELSSFQEKVARLGYALRMDYLRKTEGGASAPALFNAWMLDRDPAMPGERAVDVRVLLTRDQLSDLHDVLQRVLERAEEGALAPENFLNQLKSLAAIVSRDPQAVKQAAPEDAGQTLADLGYMREYIADLPYRSEVMNIDLSTWQQWSAQQQFEFINKLDSKVAYYRALHDNLDLWVSLDGGPVDGDSLYPLLLEALP
ncbi:MAG TPA: vWA domain-containing protein [Gammaproteobacteria bacterium]|nr:vWA domain-containing protein [Gammaproteobacteria bacterium]